MIQIYNTLTKQKEEFKELEKGKVKMYVCGPTVYNYIHIGNARSAIAFDTVRRYLEFRGYQVQYVSNFTDVDDKIINAAKEEKISVQELTQKYIAAFYEDTKALNVKQATLNPRVMETMDDIIDFIAVLIEKGYAYEAKGDVYYRTRKFKDYGKLSSQAIDELEQGASARVNSSDQDKKEDPLDFALWKAAKPEEISWQSPWGLGRPGWHIECSVMATKFLGETIDIHAGGQDLEFPHHENEIAQSEAKTGKQFARYWLHNGFVTVGKDDEKMSKSLGNFVTVHELVKQIDPQIVRFLMATTQYRHPIRYNETSLTEAKTNLAKLTTAWQNLAYRLNDAKQDELNKEIVAKFEALEEDFIAAMDDDFNAQNGITVVYEMAKLLNIYANENIVTKATLVFLQEHFAKICAIFGIEFTAENELLDQTIEELILERNEARKNKDFARSDEIRDQLKQQGIILEDTAQGTRWKRI